MPRKLIVSGLALFAAASVVGGATYAKFSDTEVAAGQSITAGTLNLGIDGTAVSAPFALNNAKPGDRSYGKWTALDGNLPSIPSSVGDLMVHLVNSGSVDGVVKAYIVKDSDTENNCNAVEAAATGENSDCATSGTGTGELDSNLDLMLGGATVAGFGAATVGDKILVDTFSIAGGGETWKRVFFEIPETTGNIIQSDGTSFHYEFVMGQA